MIVYLEGAEVALSEVSHAVLWMVVGDNDAVVVVPVGFCYH